MKPLRVGLVGCGQIAQIMHLPYLAELPQFEIGAVCDLSTTVVDAVGERYGVARRYTDYCDLVRQDDLDAGKHLFIEKPLAFSPADCDLIIDAARRNRVQVMVGYMKRFDPGYQYGAARMQAMEDVRLIRMHNIAGDFDSHLSLYPVVTGDDVPQAMLDSGWMRIHDGLKAVLGESHAQLHYPLFILLMLCSHDLTVLRGVFGAPRGVLYSDAFSAKEMLSVLDYGPGRRCIFEAGVWPSYTWWDESLTAYGKNETVRIAFPNAWLKNAASVVTVWETQDGMPVRKDLPVSHQEKFRREWLHFYECLKEGAAPLTNAADARADVELAVEMVRAVRVN
jgi:predicted dehydrogenase